MNNAYTQYETAWCPGCGNFPILDSLEITLEELNISPHKVMLVGGIGQAAKTPQYLNTNAFAGLHGRALPVAVASKIANSNLKVIVNTGDGDSYGEGGNHFLHNIRRNVDITHFVHDNQIYGLTKGQASPTSNLGHITNFTPDGVINKRFNPILIAIALGAGFVARAYSGEKDHLVKIMKEAISYKGYALVDILQPCPSFNKLNTYKWYSERVYTLDQSFDYTNRELAMKKSEEWGDKIPLGIIYKEKPASKTYLDHFKFAKDTPLVDLETKKGVLNNLINEFI